MTNPTNYYDLQSRTLEVLAEPVIAESADPDLVIDCLEDIEEEPIEWLIKDYLPKGQITLICGTGGTGKTSVWVSLAASLSSGTATLFDGVDRSFSPRKPQRVMFFSAEDTVENVIRAKVRTQGGNLKDIFTISISDERFERIKFGSEYLEKLIAKYKPTLCIFDPLQSFVDAKIKMSDRNAMRQSLRCLIEWGKKYGTTFLIVMHTNKQSNVWGRQRMADSADLWDIARCVWMVGETQEDGIKYLSHEKSNYGKTGQTMLFKNSGGHPTFWSWTDLKDRDYVIQAAQKRDEKKNGADIDGAVEAILSELSDHPEGVRAADLDDLLNLIGFSSRAIKAAKKSLKERHAIEYKKNGMSAGWTVKMIKNQ